ncbi:MAG TPA: MnhB domain-containing protein, partial [Flavobacterium sp.]|nr:MnhB domain-containing protein [Flavobacterium sp.]
PKETVQLFRFQPMFLIPLGLMMSFLSGLLPTLLGRPFMTGVWFADSVVVIGSFGSALIFDLGVYLVVIGVVLTILFTISENEEN